MNEYSMSILKTISEYINTNIYDITHLSRVSWLTSHPYCAAE